MNESIFKAYDIRGVYPDELDASGGLAIGRAIARFLGAGRIVIGRDMRDSGVLLRQALSDGLREEGVDVVDIGRVSTPMVYFAATELDAAGGVMITASHNPGQYNGFKICGRSAVPIGIESGLRDIRAAALALDGTAKFPARGEIEERDLSARYFESLLEMFPARPRLKVVIDCGNGIAGEAIEGLLSQLPLEVTRLYFEADGTFPNHEANPIVEENVADLRQSVRDNGADLGIAFDGDGDRAVFVDENGDTVPADLMTALLSRYVLEHGLGGKPAGRSVVYDLRSSRIVAETIKAAGGEALRCRVGHAFMKARMRETGASFGGELSGHYYFSFPSGYIGDDGSAAMMLLLQVLADTGRGLSELWHPLRRYRQSGEINSKVKSVDETLERVQAAFPGGKTDQLDGLTVSFDDWWFNLRPSNTEPLLRLNVEAPSDAELVRRRDEILAVIRAS